MKFVETLFTGLMRIPIAGGAMRRAFTALNRATVGAMKRVDKDYVRPRNWSNAELRRLAPLFDGDVINVSGWRDEDKTGGHYRDYFTNASSYSISNFRGESGHTGADGELFMDLETPLPQELERRFQVAFNHTTLEHVYDIHRAVANICALSDDTVILVTPFIQQVHYIEGSFGDWWRPSPMCLTRMLEENGFHVVYQSSNDNPWYIVYVTTVACRSPWKHSQALPEWRDSGDTGVVHFGIATDKQ